MKKTYTERAREHVADRGDQRSADARIQRAQSGPAEENPAQRAREAHP